MKINATIRLVVGFILGILALCNFAVLAQTKAPTLLYPNGLALDSQNNLYISDLGTHQILKLDKRGKLTVIAGTGTGGFSGDGGAAITAQLHAPHDLTFDVAGNLYIADTYNQRIRKIDARGAITTIAGNGKAGYAGDGGAASAASIHNPQSLAFDANGNLLIADTFNHVIRRIDKDGVITTIAGTVPGHGGDGGLATNAQINLTMAVAVAPSGEILISDAANSRIRKISADGKIQTIIGYGPAADTYGGGFAGDGGPPEKAKIFSATDLKFDASGNLYIVDSGNHRLRVVRNGIVTTIVGTGNLGAHGDGAQAAKAELHTPQKIVIAKDGTLFISDRGNGRVRKIDARGVITTIAGLQNKGGMIFTATQ